MEAGFFPTTAIAIASSLGGTCGGRLGGGQCGIRPHRQGNQKPQILNIGAFLHSVAVCVLGFVSANAQQVPTNAEIRGTLKKESGVLAGINVKFGEIAARLEELRAGLSELDRKKIEPLISDVEKMKTEATKSSQVITELRAAAQKQGDDISELKRIFEQLRIEQGKIDQFRVSKQRFESVLEQFKAFTRLKCNAWNVEVIVELEAERDGKQIPLANRKVRVSLQYKDGPLKLLDTIVTDANGIIRTRRAGGNLLPPTYMVFEFAGDSENRPCDTRAKIR